MKNSQLNLSEEDLQKVSKIIKSGDSGRSVSRAIVLKMKHKGFTNIEAAEIAEVTPRTVINICTYFVNAGIESALNDDPRPGRPVEIDDRIKSKIVATVCSDPPEGFDRWTLELLKERAENKIIDTISNESLRLILHEHDFKPWRYKMWCVPDLDEKYIKRMNAILDLYAKPYNSKEPVVCVDEKPVALFGDKRKAIPFSKGKPNRKDYEYSRNGSANVFCGVEPLKGRYFNKVTEYKKKPDFAEFLKDIYDTYKNCSKINLVLNNYATHFESCILEQYGETEGKKIWDKFNFYYTPTHASWLNQAEIAIGMYSRQCLGNTRIDSTEFLEKKTKSWNRIANEKNITIKWKFNKKDAQEKFNLK